MAKKDDPQIEIKAKLSGSDKWKDWGKEKSKNKGSDHSSGGAFYFVGFLGALVYNMQAAVGFGAVVSGFLKSLIWPAYFVYKFLESAYGIVG